MHSLLFYPDYRISVYSIFYTYNIFRHYTSKSLLTKEKKFKKYYYMNGNNSNHSSRGRLALCPSNASMRLSHHASNSGSAFWYSLLPYT